MRSERAPGPVVVDHGVVDYGGLGGEGRERGRGGGVIAVQGRLGMKM